MSKLAADTSDWVDAPLLAPAQSPIDRAHLARMTLGERNVEREVLMLFDTQAEILVARMRDAGPAAIAAFAHTLKGSARGIGAWRVAEAADALEVEAVDAPHRNIAGSVAKLSAAVIEAKAQIAELLRSCAPV